MQLTVSIEKNGKLIPVGTLSGENAGNIRFSYMEEYLSMPKAVPISISLPLNNEPFSSEHTRNFFEGLLPEGFVRKSIAQMMRVEENDYISILHGLGQECLGAICITNEDDHPEYYYEEISAQQVRALAREGVTKSVQMVANAHLSLTGASGKAGVYYDEEHDKWYLPRGLAPSTHIVKQSHVRLDRIVANEQLCMLTAEKCSIQIPKSFIINTGQGYDEDILYATKRFDRVPGNKIDREFGISIPYRLHQEDFAQALSLPSFFKYENGNQNYLKKMFELARSQCADPISDQMKLWDAIVFDFLIGNTDAHLKNFSFLYGPNLTEKKLAPVYDIVSTAIYESSTREMAVCIGGESLLDNITKSSFMEAADEAGIGTKIAMKRLEAMCEKFENAVKESADRMIDDGFKYAGEIAEDILRFGGYGLWNA